MTFNDVHDNDYDIDGDTYDDDDDDDDDNDAAFSCIQRHHATYQLKYKCTMDQELKYAAAQMLHVYSQHLLAIPHQFTYRYTHHFNDHFSKPTWVSWLSH